MMFDQEMATYSLRLLDFSSGDTFILTDDELLNLLQMVLEMGDQLPASG